MKKSFPFLLVVLALAAHAASAQSGRRVAPQPTQTEPPVETRAAEDAPTRPAPAVAKTLPESVLNRELQALDKGSFRLADFGGKVFVINLWATWCGPCRREIPEYEEVRKAYAARGVEFIALTTEDPRTDSERVKKFVREFNFGFRIGWLDRQTAITLMNGRSVLPQTFIIAADGHIVRHFRGYSPGRGAAMLRESLDSALSDK
ncbi:MAG: TlpA family protein disulfide reductase [Rubrivivax sp.]|nr:TlpA family protein disulfide reductase [Pyrinomonadaceae bacterium]